MNALLARIRQNPDVYLPEVSVQAFKHFKNGDGIRSAMEGQPYDWEFDQREFWSWLEVRFHSQDAAALNDAVIISSFARNDADAFREYFALLEEFLEQRSSYECRADGAIDRKDFVGLIKAIRERPALHLGSITFRGLCAYPAGDECAYRDLNCSEDSGRVLFEEFKLWIEKEKNKALPRKWFKVVRFWSGDVDYGTRTSGAFTLFFHWLDEFAAKVGEPKLFQVEVDWIERLRQAGP